MTCKKSTMIRLGIGAAIILVAAYALFPAFQAWIVTAAPVLPLLVCPLMMLFCMRGMHKDAPATDNTQQVKPVEHNPNGTH